MAVRWFDDCGRGAGSGRWPVGTRRLGNNDALPAVVTYSYPAGEVQMGEVQMAVPPRSLLVLPTPERVQQMMKTAQALQIRGMRRAAVARFRARSGPR
jgi:hypothetical protein